MSSPLNPLAEMREKQLYPAQSGVNLLSRWQVSGWVGEAQEVKVAWRPDPLCISLLRESGGCPVWIGGSAQKNDRGW